MPETCQGTDRNGRGSGNAPPLRHPATPRPFVASKGKRYHEFVKFRVLIEQDEDGVFVASCPTLPGCVSQGRTREEARTNIGEAITGYLASLRKHGEPVPPPIDEDIVEVAV